MEENSIFAKIRPVYLQRRVLERDHVFVRPAQLIIAEGMCIYR